MVSSILRLKWGFSDIQYIASYAPISSQRGWQVGFAKESSVR